VNNLIMQIFRISMCIIAAGSIIIVSQDAPGHEITKFWTEISGTTNGLSASLAGRTGIEGPLV